MIHFIIGCFTDVNTGKGGHYYSLLHLHESLNQSSCIVVIGDFFPPVYNNVSDVIFIRCSRSNLFLLKDYTSSLTIMPSIIHSYDLNTASYAARLTKKLNIPFILTKPGGPAQRRHYAPYLNQIVFHARDVERFQNAFFRPQLLKLIPQRVKPIPETSNRYDPFCDIAEKDDLRIICVSRIGHYYQRKLDQAIALYDELSRRKACSLAIIGTVENLDVLSSLQIKLAGRRAIIHTDIEYTHDAAELLSFADAAVASGRSFMEAFSLGLYTFFPVQNSKLPCLATPGNLDEAMLDNFSERVTLSKQVKPDILFEEFCTFIGNASKLNEYRSWATLEFSRRFDVNTGAQLHEEFYSLATSPEQTFVIHYNRLMILLSALLKRIPLHKLLGRNL